MKNPVYHILLLLFILITSPLSAQQNSSIVIKTKPDKEFIYWFSGQGYLSDYEQGFAVSEKGQADKDGFFHKEFSINNPVVLNLGRLAPTKMTVLPVYLTAGCRDTITVTDEQIIFQGTNANYNRCLQVTETFMDYCNQLIFLRPSEDVLFKTRSLPEFTQLLETNRTQAENKIKQFNISNNFIDEQIEHLDLVSRMAFMFKVLTSVPDLLLTEEWKQACENMMNEPLNHTYFTSFRQTFFLLSAFLSLQYKMTHGTTNGFKNLSADNFESLSLTLSGRNLEYAWATLINDDICRKANNPIVPELYRMLTEHFPENTYKSFLETGVQLNLQFNNVSLATHPDDYHILSCDSSFQSLADVLKPFKGKVVYVDIWATWCAPCLNQFPYLSKLREKTKELDVVYFYISVDSPEKKVQWEKSIQHYDLKGYHLHASPELAEGLRKEFGNYIPRYIVIDKEGNIAFPAAPAPEQTDILYEKLKQLSN